MMLTQMEILKIFWSWGNHDLNYYKTFVQYNAISADEYKQITGQDYSDQAATSGSTSINASGSASASTSASESSSTSEVASTVASASEPASASASATATTSETAASN